MTQKKINLCITARSLAFNQKFETLKSRGSQPKTRLMSVWIQTQANQKLFRKEGNLRSKNNLKKALMMRIAKKEIRS